MMICAVENVRYMRPKFWLRNFFCHDIWEIPFSFLSVGTNDAGGNCFADNMIVGDSDMFLWKISSRNFEHSRSPPWDYHQRNRQWNMYYYHDDLKITSKNKTLEHLPKVNGGFFCCSTTKRSNKKEEFSCTSTTGSDGALVSFTKPSNRCWWTNKQGYEASEKHQVFWSWSLWER